jgi:integrase/recombinase XerD
MQTVFDLFVREKTFLQNVSPLTVRMYRKAFDKFLLHDGSLSRIGISTFVVGMREAGLSPAACNVHIRAINSFLSWCGENKHTAEHLKIKLLKQERKVVETFTDAHIKAIVHARPTGTDKRTQVILFTLIDTGLRIDEALSLTREAVDLDNLLLKVRGKGNKERVIPFSRELRKALYLYLKTHKHRYLFPVRSGDRMLYRNFLRDMVDFCQNLGITGVRISPHTLRHTFAVNYLRHGGNVFALQRILGHEDLAMTRRYVNFSTDDLSSNQARTSLLSRLK